MKLRCYDGTIKECSLDEAAAAITFKVMLDFGKENGGGITKTVNEMVVDKEDADKLIEKVTNIFIGMVK